MNILLAIAIFIAVAGLESLHLEALISLIVLTICSNVTLFLTALKDPGIIPRIMQRSSQEQNKYAPFHFYAN